MICRRHNRKMEWVVCEGTSDVGGFWYCPDCQAEEEAEFRRSHEDDMNQLTKWLNKKDEVNE